MCSSKRIHLHTATKWVSIYAERDKCHREIITFMIARQDQIFKFRNKSYTHRMGNAAAANTLDFVSVSCFCDGFGGSASRIGACLKDPMARSTSSLA